MNGHDFRTKKMKMLNNTLMSKNPISRSNLYLYSSHKAAARNARLRLVFVVMCMLLLPLLTFESLATDKQGRDKAH